MDSWSNTLRHRGVALLKGHAIWATLSVVFQSLTIVILKSAALRCGKAFCFDLLPIYAVAASFIVFRVVVWNIALRRGSLSNVYIYTALNPVVLLVLSVAFLHEHVSPGAIVGACVISVAIYLHRDKRS